MSNDVRTDIGSAYSFRIEASATKRVRLLNLGPDSVYYDAAQEVSVAGGTEIATGDSVDFATPQWVISAGSSRAYVYHYEWDDTVDWFETSEGSIDPDDEQAVFRPEGISAGDSVEWDGAEFIPAQFAEASELGAKQDEDIITANGLGTVVHGATAGTARATGFARVLWIGSVTPSNATDDDLWVDTS